MKEKIKRKCKHFLILCLLLFLFQCTAYASTSSGREDSSTNPSANSGSGDSGGAYANGRSSPESGSGGTGSLTITDENRFDPKFYLQPEKRYPISGMPKSRSARAGQDLESYILKALQQFQTAIDVSGYGISKEKAEESYFQVLNSHPELFYVEGSVSWDYNSSGTVIRYKNISYRDTKANVLRQQQELDAAAEQALEWVEPTMSDVEKALILHDYLVLNCEYDEERRQNGTVPPYSHSAYGALVSGLAVCDGYSHAYAYLLNNKLGIPCELVTSNSMGHAWSMVSIGGEWYHVDVTWDDPIWDCIGRVKHGFFLISDTVISDSSHQHGNWSAGHKATSNTYRNAFWKQISSGFCYQGGNWYYAKYGGNTHGVDLVKKESLLGTEETILFTEPGLWNQYRDSYMYLDIEPKSGKIYFNTRTGICRLEQDGTVRTVYEPVLSGSQLIFGFTIKGEQVRYWLQGTPNLQGKQKISFFPLAKVQLPELGGIFAADVETAYDGAAKEITVEGIQPGDQVFYAGGTGEYQLSQPKMADAGSYLVKYRVGREGYEPYFGEARIVIKKAKPNYSLPTGLKGQSGSTLLDVMLPQGFVWEDTGIRLAEEGAFPFYAQYIPEDTKNYETVPHLAVGVSVSCPGHQYALDTEGAGSTGGGERYRCRLCGNIAASEGGGGSGPGSSPSSGTEDGSGAGGDGTQTEDSNGTGGSGGSSVSGGIGGISAQNIKVPYDGTPKEITVEGIQPSDIVSYADGKGIYAREQPRMVAVGNYSVKYKVEREGCTPFFGEAMVTIEKAVPTYALPAGLEGNSGMAVREISLPKGFVWQTAPDTYLKKEGTFQFYVKFVPEDTQNFLEILNLPVDVTVSCPGHKYTVKTTREATRACKGQRTYTCNICGHAYTRDFSLPVPEKPGKVSGLKLIKISSSSLKFSWEKTTGIRYRLVLYRKGNIVDAKDTSADSGTFSGLTPSAAYTLKVRPYRKLGGRRVYGEEDGSLKAVTAPAKAKLLSVKKTGASKAKLTWKKVPGADGYQVFMRTGKGGYKAIKTIPKGKTATYTKAGLKKGKPYRFRIRAYKKIGGKKAYGSYSNEKALRL